MLSVLLSIIIFLITITVLVMIHELGHFSVARYCGIKVLRFSVGFGKPIWTWQDKTGTEYRIAKIPLGGYVQLSDEQASIFKRMAVVLAGPFANFLFAAVMYWIVLSVGITHVRPLIGYIIPGSIAAESGLKAGTLLQTVDKQPVASWADVGMEFISHVGERKPLIVQAGQKDYQFELSKWKLDPLMLDWLSSIGIEPALPAEKLTVKHISPYQTSARSGIKAGDTLLAIQEQPITDRAMFLRTLKPYAGQAVRLTFERDGRRLHAMVYIEQCRSWKGIFEGYLGLTFAPIHWPQTALYTEQAPLFQAAYIAIQKTGEMAVFNLTVLYKLVHGDLSIQGLSGPLGIFSGSLLAMKQGFMHYLSFLAMLSIGLGIINLFPIPGLDGARVIYLLIEWGRGRPLSVAMETLLFRIGLAILLVLMIQIFIADIARFIQMSFC